MSRALLYQAVSSSADLLELVTGDNGHPRIYQASALGSEIEGFEEIGRAHV